MGGGFSHNGKTLLSGVDPAGRADKIADAVPVMDGTLYFCPSPLFGYGLERLLSRLTDAPHSALLCIESDPELFALSQKHFSDSLRSNTKLRLTNKCEAGALCVLLRQEWGPRFFRRIQTVRLSGGWQLSPALYNMLAESLQREIALDWGNAMTLTKLGRLYIRNALRNLPLIPRWPSLARLSFGRRPLLVLGAGSSLDSTLDVLSRRFGETCKLPQTRPFGIVCVDTCLPALRERGITPDLVVILESQHWNLGDFTGLSGWKIPAAFDLSAYPRSGTVLSGGLFLFFTPWTKLRIFDRLEAAGILPAALPPLGSVGLSAVAIACRLTQGVILTAGLDFSFTLDSYHARSTPGHSGKLRRQNRLTSLLNAEAAFDGAVFSLISKVEGTDTVKSGDRVLSDPAMRRYRDLFEREFSADHRLFDIVGSGLPLGIKTLSPEVAFGILSGDNDAEEVPCGDNLMTSLTVTSAVSNSIIAEKLRIFIQNEQDCLILLRNLLTASVSMDYTALDTLINECDYLWAHFPDYAAADCRPVIEEIKAGKSSAVSFLKRLRVEIDPFLRLLDYCKEQLMDYRYP
ncbi:MAG: DUF115 domain-containing protein [Treponema sp.]|nr:DUF115 domain-containing protein [Treponema sp.]